MKLTCWSRPLGTDGFCFALCCKWSFRSKNTLSFPTCGQEIIYH